MAAISLVATPVDQVNVVWHIVGTTTLPYRSLPFAKPYSRRANIYDCARVRIQPPRLGSLDLVSLVSPTTHSATIDRNCEAPQVDFQFVCTSGIVSIGQFHRFLTFMAICIVAPVLCYANERMRHPRIPNSQHGSLFLAASAKYVFEHDRWVDRDMYFMDPSSDVLNGILSHRVDTKVFIFDLKLWRCLPSSRPTRTGIGWQSVENFTFSRAFR
ncbi:Aste57867_514 [Aphanomyces stellatus]|uniref:Aste57867_514 protein n=1 Tax=Aphanomyces stellatus TaxID=120398 RepID=A0A485K605_9STRA|nr:hypothetical protein As57867_000513 [Aphanomyces stellatus]VFT77739.1 Aste57867_514 [Aphanomyces stellatus]